MGKLIHITMDDEDLGTCPLHEYMEMEEGLSIPEMYALNTLAIGDTYAIGGHTGYACVTRLHNEPISTEEYVDAGGFACPGCGDTRFLKVERFILAQATLRCTECKATWTEEYTLARYSNFSRGVSNDD
jgi:predicted RNA-binding Zn-ribbon protein involved in translation (DUF1610 family)